MRKNKSNEIKKYGTCNTKSINNVFTDLINIININSISGENKELPDLIGFGTLRRLTPKSCEARNVAFSHSDFIFPTSFFTKWKYLCKSILKGLKNWHHKYITKVIGRNKIINISTHNIDRICRLFRYNDILQPFQQKSSPSINSCLCNYF